MRPANLPNSEDPFWEGEKYLYHGSRVHICPTHGRTNWMNHKGYIDNRDGTISCQYCPWGAKIDGRYRVKDGEIVDLSKPNRS